MAHGPERPNIKKLQGVTCPYCNQKNTLTASTSANYFHLFWIKLFKISTNVIVECSHCKRVYYKEEFSEEMGRALEREHKSTLPS